MHELKLDKYKGSLLLKFAILCLAVFLVVSLIGQQRQIAEKRETLQSLQAQLTTQDVKNEELRALWRMRPACGIMRNERPAPS